MVDQCFQAATKADMLSFESGEIAVIAFCSDSTDQFERKFRPINAYYDLTTTVFVIVKPSVKFPVTIAICSDKLSAKRLSFEFGVSAWPRGE